ncbi:hypothetical protein [Providencia manganoxydans]|uniref:hypothetical protein n=1 Tax=Providencia manganoxydans TaxID=2923283 RepID=UPI0032DB4027
MLMKTLFNNKIVTLCLIFLYKNSYSQGLYGSEITPEIVKPPSCEVISPDGGQYQINKVQAHHIKRNDSFQLPEMNKTWLVICDIPVSLFLQFIDNRKDSSPIDNNYFGLGNVNGNGKLGAYQIILNHAKIDDKPARIYVKDNATNGDSDKIIVSDNHIYGFSLNDNNITNGEKFSINILVKSKLNSLKETNGPLIDGAELDGSAELIFSFGI